MEKFKKLVVNKTKSNDSNKRFYAKAIPAEYSPGL